jgi:FAD:protein FMN transferase
LPSPDTRSTVEDPDHRGLWRAAFSALGGSCELVCETDDARLAERLGAFARGEARRIDRKFSRSEPGSVVNAILGRRGKRYRVDDETARLLDYGAALWRLSGGAFDLTSGVLRHAWNCDRGTARVDAARLPGLLKRIGWGRVGWQPADIILPEDMEIDFGGIGKEYAVDRIAEWARAQTNCPVLINFGGDLRCVGAQPASGAWMVLNESIATNGKVANRVALKTGALATSGSAQRQGETQWSLHGLNFDARTGWPVEGAPRSITVAASTCSQAASYSTLAMLQGARAESFLDGETVRYWSLR